MYPNSHNVRDINITINDDSINVDNDVKYFGYMSQMIYRRLNTYQMYAVN